MFSRPWIALAPLLGLFPTDSHLSWNAVPQTGPSAPAAVRKQKDYFTFLTYANIVYTTQYDVWVFGNSLTFLTQICLVFALAPHLLCWRMAALPSAPLPCSPHLSPEHTALRSALSCTLFALGHFSTLSRSFWILILQSLCSPSWLGIICRFNSLPSRILTKPINSSGPKKQLEESILVGQWTSDHYFFSTVS